MALLPPETNSDYRGAESSARFLLVLAVLGLLALLAWVYRQQLADAANAVRFRAWAHCTRRRTSITISRQAAAASAPNPGRTAAAHRLNRAEYTNAIRDLLDLWDP